MLSIGLGLTARKGARLLPTRVAAILRKFGANAHLWMPGVGYLNGFQAGNYIESIGYTMGAVDNPVGIALDAAGSAGPELFGYVSSLTAYSGTVLDVGNGVTKFTFSGNDPHVEFLLTIPTTRVGKRYKYSVKVWTDAGQPTDVELISCNNVYGDISASGVKTISTVPAEFSIYPAFGSGGNSTQFIARLDGKELPSAGQYLYFSGVSIKEVAGIHVSQATTANKPILRRGIVNNCLYGSDLSVAQWASVNLTKTSKTLTRTATGAAAYATATVQAGVAPIGGSFTVAVKAKVGSAGNRIGIRGQGTYPSRVDCIVDLSTGALVGTNAVNYLSAMASVSGPDPDGFYLIALSGVTATSAFSTVIIGPTDSSLSVAGWEVGSAFPSDVVVDSVGLFSGTLNAMQIQAAGGIPVTTSSPASSKYGVGAPVLGAEKIVNGDFSFGLNGWNLDATGGPITESSGVVTMTSTAGARVSITQVPGFLAGKTYALQCDVFALSGSFVFAGNTGETWKSDGLAVGKNYANFTFDGGGVAWITIKRDGGAASITLDKVSVREVIGYKSIQNQYSWQFDGVNDVLTSSQVPFRLSDDLVVIAGMQNADPSTATTKCPVCFGNASQGMVELDLAASSNFPRAVLRDDSGFTVAIQDSRVYSGSIVMSAVKSSANKMLRVNGVQKGATNTNPLGVAADFTTTAIGARYSGGTFSSYANGFVYPVIAIKGTVSDSDLKTLEKWVGSIAGVSIS